MNTSELLGELRKLKIPGSWYRIGNMGENDSRLCLETIDGIWTIYFSERGKHYEVTRFDSEDAACRVFLDRMKASQERDRKRRTEPSP